MVVWLTALLSMVATPAFSDDLYEDPKCEKHIQYYDVFSVAVHAGEVKKQEVICPERNLSEIRLVTKINVLVLVTRYTFESRVRALFDDQGVVEYYSFSEYDGDISEWEGRREGGAIHYYRSFRTAGQPSPQAGKAIFTQRFRVRQHRLFSIHFRPDSGTGHLSGAQPVERNPRIAYRHAPRTRKVSKQTGSTLLRGLLQDPHP